MKMQGLYVGFMSNNMHICTYNRVNTADKFFPVTGPPSRTPGPQVEVLKPPLHWSEYTRQRKLCVGRVGEDAKGAVIRGGGNVLPLRGLASTAPLPDMKFLVSAFGLME